MSSELRQYVYVSKTADRLGQPEIMQILEASARNNPSRDVTGFLMYDGQNFLQLVEGPPSSLTELMRTLETDPRHSSITHLEDHAIDERSCGTWRMNRIALADDIATRQAKLRAMLPSGLKQKIRQTVLDFASMN